MQSDSSKLEQAMNHVDAANVGTVRAKFLAYLVTVAHATSTVSNKLKAAGAPSLTNGAVIEGIVSDAFGKLSNQFAAEAEKSHSFSHNLTVFANQAAAAGTTLHTDETDLGSTIQGLSKYTTGAFKTAASKVPHSQKIS